MFPGNRFHSVNSVTRLHTVQVNRQNMFLCPEKLNQNGEIGFQSLSQPRRPGPEKHVFSRLLTDGACPPGTVTGLILFERFFNFYLVESAVIQETLVFR